MLTPILSQQDTIDKQIKNLVDEFGNDADGIYVLESALCIAAGIRPEIREENSINWEPRFPVYREENGEENEEN